MAKSASKRSLSNGTTAGLLCALVGPYLTYLFLNSIYGPTQLPGRIEVGLVLHWINLAALILIIFLVERRSLASIGGQSLRWWTVPFGALAGVTIIVLSGVLTQALGLGADTAYVAYLQSLPFVLRVLLTMTAGIFEETLYRGYGVERLASLSGHAWLAGAVTLTLFTLMHLPAVGWAHLTPVAIVGVFMTLLYLWRRNLVVNVVAHITIDGFALLIVPLIHR